MVMHDTRLKNLGRQALSAPRPLPYPSTGPVLCPLLRHHTSILKTPHSPIPCSSSRHHPRPPLLPQTVLTTPLFRDVYGVDPADLGYVWVAGPLSGLVVQVGAFGGKVEEPQSGAFGCCTHFRWHTLPQQRTARRDCGQARHVFLSDPKTLLLSNVEPSFLL